jgi:hypothetical protein
MTEQPSRFEVLLPKPQRRELDKLAREVGLNSSDLARLGIGRLLRDPAAPFNAARSTLFLSRAAR